MKPWSIWHTVGQLWLLVAAGIAYASNGDPHASGIVEESLGGPSQAFLVGLVVIAVPALVVAVGDGVLSRRSTRPRAIARAALVLVLAFIGGMSVIVAASAECDGTCIDPPTGVVFAAFAAAEIGMLGSWALGRKIAHGGRHHRGVTPSHP